MFRKLLIGFVSGATLAGALLVLPATTPLVSAAEVQDVLAVKGWKLAGKYRSYKAACKKAKELEDEGYQTSIKKQGGTWCVYCR
jgi:hypothetical protein